MPSRSMLRALAAAVAASALTAAVAVQEASARARADVKDGPARATASAGVSTQAVSTRAADVATAARRKDPSKLRLPVHPVKGTLEHTGRLVVKFEDALGVRASRRLVPAIDHPSQDLSLFNGALARYGATVRQAIDLDSDVIEGLRKRAFERSGRSQPDLCGMMLVEGVPEHVLVAAAQEMLMLPQVQWVEIERKTELAQCEGCGEPGCPTCTQEHAGPFCGDGGCCETIGAIRPICTLPADEGGVWDEVCAALANMICTPSAFGTSTGGYDTCLQPTGLPPLPIYYEESVVFGSSCFIPRAGVGCQEADCCRNTCFADVTCCTISWDEECAALAMGIEECYNTSGYNFPGGKPTGNPTNPNTQSTSPLFDQQMLEDPQPPFAAPGSAPLALYTTAKRAPDPYSGPNPPPPDLGPFVQFADITMYRGGGLDLDAFRFLQEQFPGEGPFLNGSTITIGLVEPSALVDHEDLSVNPDGTGGTKILVETGQTPLIICDQTVPPPTFSGSFYTAPHHGTANLGILAANENEFGVTGIAKNATIRFYPTETVQAQGRLLTALTNAVSQLSSPTSTDPEPANVVLIPITETGQPLWTSESRATVIGVGADAGVTVVLAAGNAASPVNEPDGEQQELAANGSITVGGCNPGFEATEPPVVGNFPTGGGGLNYCRTGISNFDSSGGGLVTISGWGSGVCTLGYGDLFCGEITAVSNPCETNLLRTYTARYTGTSAGSAQIAAVTALVQGFAKQIYGGLGLSPTNIRALYLDQDCVYPQCGTAGIPGTPAPAWVGDTIPGPGDARIGGFPNLRRMGVAIVSGQIGDGSLFGANDCTFKLVCGKPISGNNFSIRELDRKYLKSRTQRPAAGQSSSGLGPPLYYPPLGRILDIQVVRPTLLASPDDLTSVNVSVFGRPAGTGSVFVTVFLYNATAGRWTHIGVQQMGANPDVPLVFGLGPCADAQDFLFSDAGVQSIAARIIAYPLGGGGQVEVWYDQLLIDFNSPLIPVPPPCE